MEKRAFARGRLCLCSLLCSIVLAIGCGERPAADAADKAVLFLGFDSSLKAMSSARPMSIVPSGIAVSSIEVELTGPGGARAEAISDAGKPVELELVPGSWTIAAKGMNADGLEIVEGSLAIRLEPSERLSRTLALRPIAGRGSISLSWSLTGEVGGALSVAGYLEGPGGERRVIESPFARPEGSPLAFGDLSSGGWTLSLSLLRDGAAVCGLADAVLVAANMTTMASVVFSPPEARMALGFLVPDYASTALGLEPAVRRAAAGRAAAFKAAREGAAAWFADGIALSATGPRLLYESPAAAASIRVDCVLAGADGMPPLSGSSRLLAREPRELGALEWGEVLIRSEQSAAAQALERGLSDCRDLAWSPSGRLLAAAGRDSNSVSLFDAAAAGSVFPLAVIGGSSEPGLVAPTRLRFVSDAVMLALSESQGAVYAISIEGAASEPTLRLAGAFADASLGGARDLAPVPAAPGGRVASAYVAAQGTDSVVLVALGESGVPASTRVVAGVGAGDMARFSRPACVAIDGTGLLLAVGTAGDDAIYLFDRDPSTGGLALRQRIDRSAFPAGAPLSDPCALAFAPDSASLFVLSYYGRAVIRLERDSQTGAFAPVAGLRSGTGGVQGFATPRSIGLEPRAGIAAAAGGGADDGLALFDTGAPGRLSYVGSILPPEGDAVPSRPTALAFSPDGSRLAVAADGAVSIFTVSIGN
jgi:WD40 repeat protein